MAGRGLGAQYPGASLGFGPINRGGTPANKGLAAPAIADGFRTPLSSLPDMANMEADPFKKSSAMVRSPEKRVEWKRVVAGSLAPPLPMEEKKVAQKLLMKSKWMC